LGKLQESLAALERVSQLGPSNPEALYVKGIVLQQLDQQQEAVAAYSKATAIAPQWARPYLNRAAAYARLGQTEQSLNDLERAVELDPECRDAAVGSPDLDSLRDNDRYRKLTNKTAASTIPRPAANP
jgi:tetratricopeptide (TPR) repeat protein